MIGTPGRGFVKGDPKGHRERNEGRAAGIVAEDTRLASVSPSRQQGIVSRSCRRVAVGCSAQPRPEARRRRGDDVGNRRSGRRARTRAHDSRPSAHDASLDGMRLLLRRPDARGVRLRQHAPVGSAVARDACTRRGWHSAAATATARSSSTAGRRLPVLSGTTRSPTSGGGASLARHVRARVEDPPNRASCGSRSDACAGRQVDAPGRVRSVGSTVSAIPRSPLPEHRTNSMTASGDARPSRPGCGHETSSAEFTPV